MQFIAQRSDDVDGTRHCIARPSGDVNAARREQGFALLIVLLAVALLALLVTQMVPAARTEAQIAGNLRSDLVQESTADGAVYAAAFHLLDRSDKHWDADDMVHRLRLPDGTITVRITDEANKINLNTASPDLLRDLLLGVGADPTTANALAGAIVDWREIDGPTPSADKPLLYRAAGLRYAPPEKPFRSLDELALVRGMTANLLTRLAPHLTIYSTYGPGPASNDPVALAAIALLRMQGGVLPFARDASGEQVVQVIATAISAAGVSFTRRAILRLDPGAQDLPCAILAWER